MNDPSLFTNPVILGQLSGSALGVLVILLIVKWLFSKVTKAGYPFYFPYILTLPIVTVLAAYGFATEYGPEWRVAFYSYLPAYVMWFSYDSLKPYMGKHLKASTARFFVAIAIGYCVGMICYGSGLAMEDHRKYSWLRNEIATLNATLPRNVDDETTMIHASYEYPNTVFYEYKLQNYTSLTDKQTVALEKIILRQVGQHYCIGKIPRFRDFGVSIVSRYVGSTGKFISELEFNTLHDCARGN